MKVIPFYVSAYARSCGAAGFHYGTPADLRPTLADALRSPRPAVIEVDVDPAEKPQLPRNVKG